MHIYIHKTSTCNHSFPIFLESRFGQGVLVGLGILGPPASSGAGAWEVPAPVLLGTGQAGAARTIRGWAGRLAYSDMAGGVGHGSG